MEFILGTHRPNWLELADVPLMVSNRTLHTRKSFPRARAPWMLDSGGFTELDKFDGWQTTAKEYVALARRYASEIGSLQAAAQMDWMVEPQMRAKTGLSVRSHQAISLANYLELLDRAPELPWMPVLQGWTPADYFRHVEMYAAAGVNLATLPLVGIGSVCRRQHLTEARYVVRQLSAAGIKLHGFGVKTDGLAGLSTSLASSDSMAWSFNARKLKTCLSGHTHKNGANCLPYALAWRQRVLAKINQPSPLFEEAA